ncbi:conserved protein of unknown function [Ruminococcaceae bacterium BL-6]|nr:conserved protein of unknown function [Ruminococcaceae bacterium BL-6]
MKHDSIIMNDKQSSVKGEHGPIFRVSPEKSRGLSVSAETAPPGAGDARDPKRLPALFPARRSAALSKKFLRGNLSFLCLL